MSLPYFFIENISTSAVIVLPEEASKHCVQVLRMKEGERVQLTGGKGSSVIARITTADRKHCIVAVEEKNFREKNTKKISIAISLLKNANRFEWFLEKVTEIGVSEIIPLICERTERQHFRFERMNNILISAMLQSQQTWLPVLHEPQSYKKIISSSSYAQKLIAHCEDHDEKKFLAPVASANEIQILIGPEGDFTKEEIEEALQENYQPVSLGETRLRSETAGVVAAALLINI
jgi:16S rRNA (uracil1498-N3)-methyltransferase